jgi:hypothetical protein
VIVAAARAFLAGLVRAVRRPRLLLFLYAVELGWSVLASLPFAGILLRVTARRPFADPLAHGLHLDVLGELFSRHRQLRDALADGAILGVAGWIVLSWFLVAGALGVLGDADAPPSQLARTFGRAAGRHAGAMARLALYNLLPLTLAILLGGVGAALGIAVSAGAGFWRRLCPIIGAAPGLVALAVAATAIDVARAMVSMEDAAPVVTRRVLVRAWKLALQRPRLIGIQVVGAAAWLLPALGYLVISWPHAFASSAAFALLVLLRQAFVAARLWARLATLDATLETLQAVRTGEARQLGI